MKFNYIVHMRAYEAANLNEPAQALDFGFHSSLEVDSWLNAQIETAKHVAGGGVAEKVSALVLVICFPDGSQVDYEVEKIGSVSIN